MGVLLLERSDNRDMQKVYRYIQMEAEDQKLDDAMEDTLKRKENHQALLEARRALKRAKTAIDKAYGVIDALVDYQEVSEPKRKKKQPLPWDTVPNLNLHSWHEWLRYKRGRRDRPYTTTRMAEWLAQWPKSVQKEIVDLSIRREWMGLIAPKADNVDPKRGSERALL